MLVGTPQSASRQPQRAVVGSSKRRPEAFPQHGPDRKIELVPWQREIVDRHPRWFFSNRSDAIRGLFCEYCARLGIRWTNPRNISVSHRSSGGAAGFVRAGQELIRSYQRLLL